MKYDLIRRGGLYIINMENRNYIIDTGSPSCFGKATKIRFGDSEFPMNRFTGKDTIEALEKELEMQIDGLVGLNALAGHHVTFNYAEGQFELDEKPPVYSDLVNMYRKGKRLVICMKIQGSDVEAALDTGASCAYVDPALLNGLVKAGSHEDYHPNIGFFTADEYRISCEVGSLKGDIIASPAGERVMGLLQRDNLRSCMSMRLFENKPQVSMDFINEVMKF